MQTQTQAGLGWGIFPPIPQNLPGAVTPISLQNIVTKAGQLTQAALATAASAASQVKSLVPQDASSAPGRSVTPGPTYSAGSLAAGAITAFSKTRGWRIAVPRGLSGWGMGNIIGEFMEVGNPNPAQQPPGAAVVSETTLEAKTGQLPWYKNWHYMVPIALGAAAASYGGYRLLRKRRR